jgi:hypothetical protein
MLPNLSALRHRAPLASTGPPALDGEGATCPITLNELSKDDDVWQPELAGGTLEQKHFYELVALATWLAEHETAPGTRGEVTPEDRIACIRAANAKLAFQGRDPLPVPEPPYAMPQYPPAPLWETSQPWDHEDFLSALPLNDARQRLPQYLGAGPSDDQMQVVLQLSERFEIEADERMARFATVFDRYLTDFPNEERRKLNLKIWIADHCQTALAVYCLWNRVQRAYRTTTQLREQLPPADAETPEAAGIFGRLVNYAQRAYARRSYELLRQQRIQKYRELSEAASEHGAAACRPAMFGMLTTAGPELYVGFSIGELTAMQWAEGVLSSTSVESLKQFDGSVRQRNEDLKHEYRLNLGRLNRGEY